MLTAAAVWIADSLIHRYLLEESSFELIPSDVNELWMRVSIIVLLIAFGLLADRSRNALLASKSRIEALLNANPDLIFRMDRDGRYLDFHAADETLLAVPLEQIIGHNMSELFEPSFVRECQEHINNALDTGEVQLWQYELPIRGEVRDFEARFVRSGTDEVLVIAQDITERNRLEHEVISIGESERHRIGRDLHDSLGQELTAVSLTLQNLSQNLVREQSPHGQTVQDLTATIQKMIGETRNIARQLSPIFSTELGLCTALRALADEVNEHSDVTCHVNCSYENDIHDAEIATHFYRIAQESINNVLRHSQAQNIELRYGRDGDSLFLTVLDDGTGIPARKNRVEGIGLRNMHYRARMLRGRLEVGLRTQGGTRVLCSCPFQPQ
jgi:PAS domain S-box-containing protein